jgi:succinate dehydrogenase/fumarate reductase flavoprotein subunit
MKPIDLFISLDRLTVPAQFSMFKSERRILKVLSEIDRLKENAFNIKSPDAHELVKASEFKNRLLCAELVFRSALERKESRSSHYREEYPYRDDIEWMKLVVLKKEDNHITVRHEPLLKEGWSIKPQRFLKISHPIQMFLAE